MSPSTESSSSSGSVQHIKLTAPTPNFEAYEFDGQSPDDTLKTKIQDLIRDLPSPPLSLPLPTFSSTPIFTSQHPSLSCSYSSKLSALVTNLFQTNQLLHQVINLLQNLLFQIGSRQTDTPTAVPTTLHLTLGTFRSDHDQDYEYEFCAREAWGLLVANTVVAVVSSQQKCFSNWFEYEVATFCQSWKCLVDKPHKML